MQQLLENYGAKIIAKSIVSGITAKLEPFQELAFALLQVERLEQFFTTRDEFMNTIRQSRDCKASAIKNIQDAKELLERHEKVKYIAQQLEASWRNDKIRGIYFHFLTTKRFYRPGRDSGPPLLASALDVWVKEECGVNVNDVKMIKCHIRQTIMKHGLDITSGRQDLGLQKSSPLEAAPTDELNLNEVIDELGFNGTLDEVYRFLKACQLKDAGPPEGAAEFEHAHSVLEELQKTYPSRLPYLG